uniref:Ig-like domain-containing protein n=1 Tax=Knipowitschia caucasica TaxID=637954 RepID=A0AAV2LLI1_KNICA
MLSPKQTLHILVSQSHLYNTHGHNRVVADTEEEVIGARSGSSVSLLSGVCLGQQRQLLWTFINSHSRVMIAKVIPPIIVELNPSLESRLRVNAETGDLHLSNLTLNDTGLYQQLCIEQSISFKSYQLIIYPRLSSPSVSVKSPGGGCCPLLVDCSTENSRNLSLSWFKGEVLLQTTSSPESPTLSLTLKLQLGETSAFVCEVQNPVEKRNVTFQPEEALKSRGQQTRITDTAPVLKLLYRLLVALSVLLLKQAT